VKVAKEDRNWQIRDIAWVFAKKAYKFHNLTKAKHEEDLSYQKGIAIPRIPMLGGPPAREQNKGVMNECQRGESSDV